MPIAAWAPSSRKRLSQPAMPPPRRFIAGADGIGLAEQQIADLKAQVDAYYDLSKSLELEAAALRE